MVSEILFQSESRHLGGGHDWLVVENQTVLARPKQLVWQEFSWMEKILHVFGFGRANLDTIEGILYKEVKKACEENKTFIQRIKEESPKTNHQHMALIGRVKDQWFRMQHLCNSIDRLDNQMRACRDKRAFFKGLLALILEVFRGKAPRVGGRQFGVYDEMDKLSRLQWKLLYRLSDVEHCVQGALKGVEEGFSETDWRGAFPMLRTSADLERQSLGKKSVVQKSF